MSKKALLALGFFFLGGVGTALSQNAPSKLKLKGNPITLTINSKNTLKNAHKTPLELLRGATVPKEFLSELLVGHVKVETKEKIDFVEFRAIMPDHRHGMNTVPKITKLEENYWEIEGIQFHMHGKWEVILNFEINKTKEKVTFPITI